MSRIDPGLFTGAWSTANLSNTNTTQNTTQSPFQSQDPTTALLLLKQHLINIELPAALQSGARWPWLMHLRSRILAVTAPQPHSAWLGVEANDEYIKDVQEAIEKLDEICREMCTQGFRKLYLDARSEIFRLRTDSPSVNSIKQYRAEVLGEPAGSRLPRGSGDGGMFMWKGMKTKLRAAVADIKATKQQQQSKVESCRKSVRFSGIYDARECPADAEESVAGNGDRSGFRDSGIDVDGASRSSLLSANDEDDSAQLPTNEGHKVEEEMVLDQALSIQPTSKPKVATQNTYPVPSSSSVISSSPALPTYPGVTIASSSPLTQHPGGIYAPPPLSFPLPSIPFSKAPLKSILVTKKRKATSTSFNIFSDDAPTNEEQAFKRRRSIFLIPSTPPHQGIEKAPPPRPSKPVAVKDVYDVEQWAEEAAMMDELEKTMKEKRRSLRAERKKARESTVSFADFEEGEVGCGQGEVVGAEGGGGGDESAYPGAEKRTSTLSRESFSDSGFYDQILGSFEPDEWPLGVFDGEM